MQSDKKLSVAICGTRGIPACYGGFETFAEELSVRLVQRGFKMVVYGRKHFIKDKITDYKGVEIRLLSAPKHKYFETPLHSLKSFIHLLFKRVDVVLVCNAANSPFVWLLRLFRIPVIINVDGIERNRAKWNLLGRVWYRLGEFCSVLFANEIVADADVIKVYYEEVYHKNSNVIAYGYREFDEQRIEQKIKSNSDFVTADKIFKELGIFPGNYLLYVSRLEPENNAHIVIQAYNALSNELRSKYPLVLVGDAPYAEKYIQYLRKISCKEVIFAGFRFGESYCLLQLAALLYIQATEVGGTHPALVESMGFANCIIANQTPENIEVLSNSGLYYTKNNLFELQKCLSEILINPQKIEELRRSAYKRAKENYTWEKVCKAYEALFLRVSNKS